MAWTTMMSILGGRLVAISLFLVFLSFVLVHDGIAFYAFIAFSYIVTIPYSLWMRNQQTMRRLAPLQFLVDLVFVSGLIYFAGSHGHDFLILLYPLIILSAGIVLPPKQTIQITALAIVLYTLIVVLMSQNILVSYPTSCYPAPLTTSAGTMALRILIFIVFGAASVYVSRRCDYIDRKEKQFRQMTHLIFKNVKTGLLLLDSDDTILMANERACILLGRDERELAGQPLGAIHKKPSELSDEQIALRATDYFRRADGSIFPVRIEDAPLDLPADAIGDLNRDALLRTRILSFNDLSHFLRLESQTHQLERIKAAANMAKEMAHQIRTPLTGISGAVQLLQLSQINDAAAGAQERAELCQQIIFEAGRMDKVIQNFLDYAEFSPTDLQDLIQIDANAPSRPR